MSATNIKNKMGSDEIHRDKVTMNAGNNQNTKYKKDRDKIPSQIDGMDCKIKGIEEQTDTTSKENHHPSVLRPKAMRAEDLVRAEAKTMLLSRYNNTNRGPVTTKTAPPPPPPPVPQPLLHPSPIQKSISNTDPTHSGTSTSLSLRPIPLSHRDRVSSVDRQVMSLHIDNGSDSISYASSYDSDADDSNAFTNSSNLEPLPLEKFLRPRSSQQQTYSSKSNVNVNRSSGMSTNFQIQPSLSTLDGSRKSSVSSLHTEDVGASTSSDDESSYFSEHHSTSTKTSVESFHSSRNVTNDSRKQLSTIDSKLNRNLPFSSNTAFSSTPNSSTQTSSSLHQRTNSDRNKTITESSSHSSSTSQRSSNIALQRSSSATSLSLSISSDEDDTDSDENKYLNEAPIIGTSSYRMNTSNDRLQGTQTESSPALSQNNDGSPLRLYYSRKESQCSIVSSVTSENDHGDDVERNSRNTFYPDEYYDGDYSDYNNDTSGEMLQNGAYKRGDDTDDDDNNTQSKPTIMPPIPSKGSIFINSRENRITRYLSTSDDESLSKQKSNKTPPNRVWNQTKHLYHMSSSSMSESSPRSRSIAGGKMNDYNQQMWLQHQQFPPQSQQIGYASPKQNFKGIIVTSNNSYEFDTNRSASNSALNSSYGNLSSSKVTIDMEYSSDEDFDSTSLPINTISNSDLEESYMGKIHPYLDKEFLPLDYLYSISLSSTENRWAFFFFLPVLNILSGWICYSFVPFATITSKAYPNLYPSGLVSVFHIAKCVGLFLEPMILMRWKLRRTITFGSVLLLFGIFVITASEISSIIQIYFGFFIVGLSTPFYENTVTALSSKPECDNILSIIWMSNKLGACCAFLFGTLLVGTVDDIPQYFHFLEWCTILTCFGVWVYLEESPSKSRQEVKNDRERPSAKSKRKKTKSRTNDIDIFRSDSIDNDLEAGKDENLIYEPPELKKKQNMPRAMTPSGKSMGPPTLYPGRAILMSNSEGTAQESLYENGVPTVLNTWTPQYGSTISLSNQSENSKIDFMYTPSNESSTSNERALALNWGEKANINASRTKRKKSKSPNRHQFSYDQVLISMKACLSNHDYVYPAASYVVSAITINTLITYMSFLIQFALQKQDQLKKFGGESYQTLSYSIDSSEIPIKYWRVWTALLGITFQGIILITSALIKKQKENNKQYYATILGLIVLCMFSIAECAISLDVSHGWDVRWSLLLVAIFIGPLQTLSSRLGVQEVSPLSKSTALMVQDVLANIFCAFLTPLFQILRNVRVLSISQDDLQQKQLNPLEQYTISFYFLILLHFCVAIFFATYKRRNNKQKLGQYIPAHKIGVEYTTAETESDPFNTKGKTFKTFV